MNINCREFYVKPTETRDDCNGDCIIRLSKVRAKEIFGRFIPLPQLVAISHIQQGILSEGGIEICAVGWLKVGSSGDPEYAELDQTLRQALGIPYQSYKGLKIEISKLHTTSHGIFNLSRIVGRRIVYCRPAVLHPVDIEKKIARVNNSVLELIGIESGENVQVCGISKDETGQYTLNLLKTPALSASDGYIEERSLQLQPSVDSRSPNISALIYNNDVEPDLHQIYLDADFRDTLFGTQYLQKFKWKSIPEKPAHGPWHHARFAQSVQPVIVFRNPWSALGKEIFALVGGLLALTIGTHEILSNFHDETYPIGSLIISVIIAILVTFIAVIIKTANKFN